MLTDGLMARFDPRHTLVGGPVMTATGEVLGIAVGASASGSLIVEPWAKLEQCIDMDVSPLPSA
jgi:hypothetical protein